MLAQLGRGVVWTYASIVVGAVMHVAVAAVTARLLPPEAFGLVAMANVVLAFGGYFAHMGVGRALIQRSTIDDVDVRAAFTAAATLGLVVAAVVVAAAPLAAGYYQTADVVPVLRWMALTFVLGGLSVTAKSLLNRQLRFRAIGVIEVVAYVLGYGAPTIALAAAGYGVWSIVVGLIGQLVVSWLLAYAVTRHSLRPTFDLRAHRGLLGYGAKVSFISILEWLGMSLDVLVIGRFGSASQLGIYNRAFLIANLPMYQLMNGITKVLFPVLSAGRVDRAEFTAAFFVGTRSAIKLLIPLGVGMALAAPEIVRVVLGMAWLEAVPLVAILAPALALNLLARFPGIALEALGILRGKAIAQAGYVVVLGAALVASASVTFDLPTVALVVGASIALRTGAYFVLAWRARVIARVHVVALLGTAVGVGLLTPAVMLAVLVPFRTLGTSPLVTLLAGVAAGGVVLAIAFRSEGLRWLRRRRAAAR